MFNKEYGMIFYMGTDLIPAFLLSTQHTKW